jgi:hypothetical protein
MVRQILLNNNEKCYGNFSPKIFTSKHAHSRKIGGVHNAPSCQAMVGYCRTIPAMVEDGAAHGATGARVFVWVSGSAFFYGLLEI